MGLSAIAAEVLQVGHLPMVPPSAAGERDPRPVAFASIGERGAVLFVHRIRPDEWMAIVALLARVDEQWDEVALLHKPWWDPLDAFEDDELMLTGGHSRFQTGRGPAVALIAGQAAPDTSIVGRDGEIVAHSPFGHFIYVAEIQHPDEPVTLIARRAAVEQTSVFEPLDLM